MQFLLPKSHYHVTENYIASHLVATHEGELHYFTFDNYYELDFLLQHHNQIIPVEIKSGKNSPHASLTRYNDIYQPPISVRFSLNDLKFDGRILNIPLYLAEYLDQLLAIAQKQKEAPVSANASPS